MLLLAVLLCDQAKTSLSQEAATRLWHGQFCRALMGLTPFGGSGDDMECLMRSAFEVVT